MSVTVCPKCYLPNPALNRDVEAGESVYLGPPHGKCPEIVETNPHAASEAELDRIHQNLFKD